MEELPASIGRFRVEALLGRGAMGVVYKAHDPDIDRTVAIKLIRADLLDGDSREEYLARFRTEARVAGRCVHPNIIGVYDFALHEGNPYLVMEYVDGVDLGRAFPPGTKVPIATVVRIGLQVLAALAYAHDFGIVHRDIKPANILLTDSSPLLLKVTDFGISRLASFDSTQSAMMVGTPSYMSPEQCSGAPVDQRCDLFALGCVLHEQLGGARTFTGASYAETLYKLTQLAHRPVREARADAPEGLSDIVDRALAKRPEDRFANARDMAAALRSLDTAASGSDHDSATVVISSAKLRPAAAPTSQTGAGTTGELQQLGGSSLATIERRLAQHIGPLASFHVRRAMREARSPDEFCRLLSELLPQEARRDVFIRDTLALVLSPGGLPDARPNTALLGAVPLPRPAITAEALEAVTRALAQIMGPIAPRLVAKALTKATTLSELEALCAAAIDRPEERKRFLSLLARAF